MKPAHKQWQETLVFDTGSPRLAVRVDDRDQREWLAGAVVCPELNLHRIGHVGVGNMKHPYNVVRTNQSGAFFLACLSGEGRILVDGRWRACRAGMACLLPPKILNAFHSVPKSNWEFCWVRYQPTTGLAPFISFDSPVLSRFDARPLRSAITGLHQAGSSAPNPSAIHHWVELVQIYVQQFSQPWQRDERLTKLWGKVLTNLAADWPGARLAREANLSFEHLRRLCHRQLGRSPVNHVTYLRMRHAADLLTDTNEKVETIAQAVGYSNSYAFSATFKRWIGWSPSDFRHGGVKDP